ncbi:hypothetical protein [Fischerella thermalis]|uniref:hypothetical protein n=1 Tax=Fischerella thermalis TaxID=372787 RepID=UPI00307EEBBD
MNRPTGSPPCQPLREAATRLRAENRQDGKWTHQDAKNAKNWVFKLKEKIKHPANMQRQFLFTLVYYTNLI